MMDRDDMALVAALAGCSLATTPGKDNWVDEAGGLPEYICEIARAIKRSGKSTSQAIAIAVSRVKKWAAGGDDVDADTRAKAAKAVAEWEAKKARSKGKSMVKASRPKEIGGEDYLILSAVTSYSLERIRNEWELKERERRTAERAARDALRISDPYAPVPDIDYRYVREVWTDFLIVEKDRSGKCGEYIKVPYEVTTTGVAWGSETPVVQTYTESPKNAVVAATARSGPLERVLALAGTPGDGQRHVATPAGERKYNAPIGTPLGPGRGGRAAPSASGGRSGPAAGGAPANPKVPPAAAPGAGRRNAPGDGVPTPPRQDATPTPPAPKGDDTPDGLPKVGDTVPEDSDLSKFPKGTILKDKEGNIFTKSSKSGWHMRKPKMRRSMGISPMKMAKKIFTVLLIPSLEPLKYLGKD